jgi:hypothetical protein
MDSLNAGAAIILPDRSEYIKSIHKSTWEKFTETAIFDRWIVSVITAGSPSPPPKVHHCLRISTPYMHHGKVTAGGSDSVQDGNHERGKEHRGCKFPRE